MFVRCGNLLPLRERCLKHNHPPVDLRDFPHTEALLQSALLSKLAYKDPEQMTRRWDMVHSTSEADPDRSRGLFHHNEEPALTAWLLDGLVRAMPEKPLFVASPPSTGEDAQAYVWRKEDSIYVVFRGSSNVWDLFASANLLTTSYGDDGVCIHSGFFRQFRSIEPQLTQILDATCTQRDIRHVVMTGHSLGSSLAQIAAAWYGERMVGRKVTCHTFGCPRAGNQKFVEWFEKYVYEHHRVVNTEDPVPMVPQRPVWRHVPNCILIDDACQVYRRDADEPWYLRLLWTLASVDMQHLTQDHDCDVYIARLKQILDQQKRV